MTDDEVAAAAAEIRRLLRPGRKIEDPVEAKRMAERETALRRALAVEYGRRRGWALARHCFDCSRLLGRRLRRHEYFGLAYPRFFDHNFGFLARGKPAAVVTHPYDMDDEVRAEMRAWAAKHGLVVSFPDFPSWWFPGWTTTVEFARPEALPSETTA